MMPLPLRSTALAFFHQADVNHRAIPAVACPHRAVESHRGARRAVAVAVVGGGVVLAEDGAGAGVDLDDRAAARGGDPEEGEGADLVVELQLVVVRIVMVDVEGPAPIEVFVEGVGDVGALHRPDPQVVIDDGGDAQAVGDHPVLRV